MVVGLLAWMMMIHDGRCPGRSPAALHINTGGDTPSIVCARGGAEKHVRVAHNAEKERNSLFWILLDHSDTE